MKPLIYGYMRVEIDQDDQKTVRLEQALYHYADHEGYCLGAVFYEYVSGSQAGFHELIRELQRAEAHHVIVPNLRHLALSPVLQVCMLLHVEHYANAQVLELGDLTPVEQ